MKELPPESIAQDISALPELLEEKMGSLSAVQKNPEYYQKLGLNNILGEDNSLVETILQLTKVSPELMSTKSLVETVQKPLPRWIRPVNLSLGL